MSAEKIFVDPSNAEKILNDIYSELDKKANKTDIPTSLPTASESTLGGVKSGGDIKVSSEGAVTVNSVNGKTVAKSVPSDAKFTDTTYSNATASSAGLMSAADKAKLDGMSGGSNYSLTVTKEILYEADSAGETTATLKKSILEFDEIVIMMGNDYMAASLGNSWGSITIRSDIIKEVLPAPIAADAKCGVRFGAAIRSGVIQFVGFVNTRTIYIKDSGLKKIYGIKYNIIKE